MLWVILAIILVIAVLFYVFPIIEVCGDSMNPTFNSGDLIVGCRIFKNPTLNQVFIFRPPVGEKYVIKRLAHISEYTGKFFFEGDNKDYSYDSRKYGYISKDKLVARYLFTIHKERSCKSNGCK